MQKEWIFKRGDILYFMPTGMAQVADVNGEDIKLCPWRADQDLGVGKGVICEMKLADIPALKFIERLDCFEPTTAKLINRG